MTSTSPHLSKSETVKTNAYVWNIAWSNVIPLTILHLAALYGLILKFSADWKVQWFYRLLAALMSFGITAGNHRLWSHRSYKANTRAQILLMMMATLTYQNSIYVWCRDHRMHHKYTETDADPHNAKRGFFFSQIGWLMLRKHDDVKKLGKDLDMSDLKANPIVMFQHKYYYILVFLLAVVIPTFIACFIFGDSLSSAIFYGVIYRYIVATHHTWFINSIAHLFGNKQYDKNIGATNNTYLEYVIFGEGFHNYHHTFPWDYKAAELGGDTRNLTTSLIDFLASLNWVTNRKTAPISLIRRKIEQSGDKSHQKFKISSIRNFNNLIFVVAYLTII